MNRLPLVIAVVLGTALPVQANAAPAELFTRYARPTHRIETRLDIRHYVFVVEFPADLDEPTPEACFVTPDPGGSVTITGGSGLRWFANLSIVSKVEVEPYRTAEDLVAAIKAERVVPILRYRFHFREQVPSWSANPVVTHELRQGTTHNELLVVRTSRSPMWLWNATTTLVGGAVSAAAVVGGVWLAWWFCRRGGAIHPMVPPRPADAA